MMPDLTCKFRISGWRKKNFQPQRKRIMNRSQLVNRSRDFCALCRPNYNPLCENNSKENWRKNMKTRTLTQTLVIALAMMLALAIVPSMAVGQNKADNQSIISPTEELGNDLVGIWEEVAPAGVDCQTREPLGPTIRALYTFNQGGTMYVEDTFPLSGPYRSTGGGIWKRTSGRNYTYGNVHYEFDPDRTFTLIIKQRSNLTLSRDGNSFTENGTFEGIDPTS